MLNREELKIARIRKGYTQETLAVAIGMTSRTFTNKLKKGNFGLDEMDAMIEVLDIKNPSEIFFKQSVT
jgi:transcriptional regulator with XRE-family HTH domain